MTNLYVLQFTSFKILYDSPMMVNCEWNMQLATFWINATVMDGLLKNLLTAHTATWSQWYFINSSYKLYSFCSESQILSSTKWITDVSWHTCFQAMLWQFRNSKAATKYQLLAQCWKRICDIKILKQVECFQICSQKAACVCHYLNNDIFLFVLAGQVYAPLHNSVMFTL